MNKIRLCITAKHEHIPSHCYPDLDICRKQVSMSAAVFESSGGGRAGGTG